MLKGDTAWLSRWNLFNIQYREGSLEPKTAEFIKFAVNLAIGP